MPKIFMYRNFGGAMPADAGAGAGAPSTGPGLGDVSNVAGNSVRHLGDDKRKVLSNLPKDQFPRQNIFFNGFSRGRLYKFAESTDDVTKEPDTSAADKAGDALKKSADEFKALTHSYVQQNSWRFTPFNFGGTMPYPGRGLTNYQDRFTANEAVKMPNLKNAGLNKIHDRAVVNDLSPESVNSWLSRATEDQIKGYEKLTGKMVDRSKLNNPNLNNQTNASGYQGKMGQPLATTPNYSGKTAG